MISCNDIRTFLDKGGFGFIFSNMVNKNDISDLQYFFLSVAGIIIFMGVLFSLGIWAINERYGKDIRFIGAKISDYAQQQWQESDGHSQKMK